MAANLAATPNLINNQVNPHRAYMQDWFSLDIRSVLC